MVGKNCHLLSKTEEMLSVRNWKKKHVHVVKGKTANYSVKVKKHTCSKETRRKTCSHCKMSKKDWHVPLLVLEPCNLQVFQAVNPPLHQVL
jgi:hypothetical protein